MVEESTAQRRPESAGHLLIAILLWAALALVPCSQVQAEDEPEYLRAEAPIAGDLDEVQSVTERIGVTPGSWLREYSPFRPRLARLFPELRGQILPPRNQPFLDDTRISVRPRFYYRNVEGWNTPASKVAALGGSIAVESGWLQELLRVSLVGYTSQRLHGSGERGFTGLLDDNQQGYSVLGEAFTELKLGHSSFFAGRARIDAPFINAQDIRMTPNTFEGVGIRSLAVENLQVSAAYISRIKFRNSIDFVPMSKHAGTTDKERGVSLIGLRYNFSDDFHVGLSEQYGWDMFNTLYLDSEKLFQLTDELDLRVGAQFTDQRSTGQELLGSFSTQTAGVKAALGYGGLITTASATTTASGSSILKPWGGTPSYHSAMIADFDRAGEDSIRLDTSFDFSSLGINGLSADINWLSGRTPDDGRNASPDQQEINYTLDYQPPIDFLENFWLRVRYAVNERDSTPGSSPTSREDFRIILNWSRTF
ncbi:MAG: OprD family outer membrane porin [Verrucomicrobiales bacterium]